MMRATTGNLDNVCGGLIHGVLVSTSFQTLMPSLAGTRRKEAFNQLVMFFPPSLRVLVNLNAPWPFFLPSPQQRQQPLT